MARRSRPIRLDAPYLRRAWLDLPAGADRTNYPLSLPLFRNGFEIVFNRPVTILVGENGVGKSTIIEALAGIAGFDEAGGGKGYMPLDHSRAVSASGVDLVKFMRAAWRPKLGGWFFRAETFFSVARYLDAAAPGGRGPDFLSHSHGEGFMRFFEERCSRQGVYYFDEPESALSPTRQIEFLKLLRRMENSGRCQVIMATHSPLLMAHPGADLLRLTRDSLAPVHLEDTDHFRLMRQFCDDPSGFIAEAMED